MPFSVKSTSRRGFTLIELSMVLAIAAIIIAAVMLFFGTTANNKSTEDAVSEVSDITQIVHTLYANQPDYSAVTTQALAGSNQVPGKWVSGASSLTNAFHGSVSVGPGAGAMTFALELDGLPQYACTQMASYDFGTGNYGTTADSTTVYGHAMTPTAALAACANQTGNTITFYIN